MWGFWRPWHGILSWPDLDMVGDDAEPAVKIAPAREARGVMRAPIRKQTWKSTAPGRARHPGDEPLMTGRRKAAPEDDHIASPAHPGMRHRTEAGGHRARHSIADSGSEHDLKLPDWPPQAAITPQGDTPMGLYARLFGKKTAKPAAPSPRLARYFPPAAMPRPSEPEPYRPAPGDDSAMIAVALAASAPTYAPSYAALGGYQAEPEAAHHGHSHYDTGSYHDTSPCSLDVGSTGFDGGSCGGGGGGSGGD